MKKIISLILTLGIVLTAFCSLTSFAAADSIYYIDSVEGFNSIANDLLGTYYVTANIGTKDAPVTTSITGFAGKLIGWDKDAGKETQRSIYAVISGKGLFATATGTFEISNITLEGSVTGSVTKTGGFIGEVSGTTTGAKITDCVNNATVSNTANVENVAGFVGYTDSEMIFSNCVNNGNVTGKNHRVAGITGEAHSSKITIENCANYGDIKTTNKAAQNIGGIVGYSQANINKCFNAGAIEGGNSIGGIIGRHQNASAISNCFNLGAVNAVTASTGKAGGIVGYCYNKAAISNVYNMGTITGAVTNPIIGSVRTGYEATVTNGYYLADATDPSTGALSPDDMKKQESFNFDFDNTWVMAATTTNYKYPNLQSNLYYVEANGTIDAPYAIASQADLEAIKTKGLDKVYSVIKSFEVSSDYQSISGFKGTILGNNNTITLNNTVNGIFATLTGSAKVSGLNVSGVISSANDNIGGIAGKIDAVTVTVESCANGASVTGKNFVGGIAGVSKGNITNCVNNGTVTGTISVGGIVGDQTGSVISYCVNNGTIVADKGTSSSSSRVGGIVGRSYTSGTRSVENCYNNGNITGNGWDMAGIVGGVHSGTLTISNCYNTGLISYVSGTGIFGAQSLNNATVTVANCYDVGVVNTYAEKPQKPISKASAVTVSNCYYLGLYDDGIDNTTAILKDAMNVEAVVASLGSAYELSSNGYNYPQLKGLTNEKEINIYTVNAVSEGNGAVTPEASYIHGGDIIEITYEAAEGYALADVTASAGDVVNTASEGSYVTPVINKDTTFTFTFAKAESEVSSFDLFTEVILKDDFKDKITDVNYDDIADNYAAVLFVKVSNAEGKSYGLEVSEDQLTWERSDLRLATGNIFPYGTYVHSKKQGGTYYARVYEYDSKTDTYTSFDNIIEFTLAKPE